MNYLYSISLFKKRALTILSGTFLILMLDNCQSQQKPDQQSLTANRPGKALAASNPATPAALAKAAPAAVVLGRKQIPILCYHQIRNWKPTDSKTAKDYIVQENDFREQMKMLADSGYHTILPDQLYQYLNTGAALPVKPIMLTFDDTDLDQYTLPPRK